MRDITGIELKEGDFIEIKAGTEWLPCFVKKIDESTLLMPLQPGQIPLVKLTVIADFNLQSLGAKWNQPVIRRIPHPEYERIVSKEN